MIELGDISIALLGGILPALLWLWFWLKEDSAHPEPRRLIALCFLSGMAAVLLVIPFEKVAYDFFENPTAIFIAWSAIEEIAKFLIIYAVVFHKRDFDEPIDAVIYMIVGALGFAALENALFLLEPLQASSLATSLITGNLRFLGATLLHVVASAGLGVFIAFSFYKDKTYKELLVGSGLLMAVTLHTLFNLSIMSGSGQYTVIAFYSVWLMAVILLLFFERIKRIKKPYTQ